MGQEPEDKSVSNPFGSKLLLSPNESIQATGKGKILPDDSLGILLITNRRILFYDQDIGHLSLIRALTDLTGISVDTNLLVGKKLRDVLRLTFTNTFLFDLYESSPPEISVFNLAELIMRLRLRELIRTDSSAILDFVSLKNILSLGDRVVIPLRCPYCHAILDLPSNGSFVKCKYCGQNSYLTQVLKDTVISQP